MKYFLTILSIFFGTCAHSQELLTTIYDRSKGFPHFEINKVITGPNANLYVLTNASQLFKFDGYTFKEFHFPSSREVSNIYFFKDRLVASTLGIDRRPDERFYLFEKDGTFIRDDSTYQEVNQTAMIDSSGQIFLYDNEIDDFRALSSPFHEDLQFAFNYQQNFTYGNITYVPLFHVNNSWRFAQLDNRNFKILDTIIAFSTPGLDNTSHEFVSFSPQKNAIKYFGSNDEIGLDQYLNPNRTYNGKMSSHVNGAPLIGLYSDGVKSSLLEIGDRKIELIGEINHSTATSMIQDKTGKFWLASFSGLVKVNPAFQVFSSQNQHLSRAIFTINEDENGHVWFGGYNTGWSYFDGNKVYRSSFFGSRRDLVLPGSFRDDDGTIYVFTSLYNSLTKIEKGRVHLIENKSDNAFNAGYIIKKFGNTYALGMQNYCLGLTDNLEGNWQDLKKIGKEKGLDLVNVLCIEQDANGRFWCGRPSTGIALYDPVLDTAITWKRENTLDIGVGAMSMLLDDRGNLWIGAHDGLYFLENPQDISLSLDSLSSKLKRIELPNLDRSMVAAITSHDKMLIFGNSSSLGIIDLDNYYDNPDNFPIYLLRYGIDIPGNSTQQNCMFIDSKAQLWVGTQDEALVCKLDQLTLDTIMTEIEFVGFSIGHHEYDSIPDEINLPKDNRNFSIKVKPKYNPFLTRNIFYDVLLTNKNDTILFDQNVEELNRERIFLGSGNYLLKITAKKNGLHMDAKSIKVNAPLSLTENPIFWLLSILFLAAGFVVFLIFRNRQKRGLLERDLAIKDLSNERDKLQIHSIINSFNPHFINNSLHWAQSKYRKDPTLVTLIGRLSENIRYLFENTRKKKAYHALSGELKIVENYIKIQQIRFGDSFEYIKPMERSLKKWLDFSVFIMQIQIHVENAIEHGLRNRIESTFVQIELEETKTDLLLKITDDGIGRNGASAKESNGTQSGTHMLDELAVIFNQVNTNAIKTTYKDDIFQDGQTRFGTQVLISIPKDYKYELR